MIRFLDNQAIPEVVSPLEYELVVINQYHAKVELVRGERRLVIFSGLPERASTFYEELRYILSPDKYKKGVA